NSDFTRLHITPFDSELLPVVVPAKVLPEARGISYHTIETFPEKRYGYIELPAVEADKLRKKLNGSVLKGVKMRIEKARPQPTAEPEVEVEENSGKKRKKKSKNDSVEGSKKRKIDHNVVPGVQIEGRKVKRGWTVSDEDKIKEKRSRKLKDKDKDKDKDQHTKEKDKKDKKKKKRDQRSKYTEKEECLLKTKLPHPTATAAEPEESPDRKERKKSKSRSRETILHEFANTTRFPTFLKTTQPSTTSVEATEFVEGKGWVDAEGNVVEAVKTRGKEEEKPRKNASPNPAVGDDTSSSSDTSSEEDEPAPKATTKMSQTAKTSKPTTSALNQRQSQPIDDDTTSSSGTSSEDEDTDDEEEDEARAAKDSAPESGKITPSRPNEKVNLTIKVPPVEVHPLEALYKRKNTGDGGTRASNDAATTPEPFSFFGGGDIEDDLEDADGGQGERGGQIPMTPYTQREFEWRNVRSAAPTPDTAHPSRVRNFWASNGEEEDDERYDDVLHRGDETMADADVGEGEGSAGPGPGGDFQKWFWDNRRDLNRSWMQRRKTATKEKRHRDNKSRAARGV
ncbi:hypothetical protein SODALDRAFT_250373, partial [Sodiomyces alkalinus F11]